MTQGRTGPAAVSAPASRAADPTVPEIGGVIERLRRAGCVAAEEEAAELLDASPDTATLTGWLSRREQGEPLAWIVGSVTFCRHRLVVDPGVYVPRAQSQSLAARAVRRVPRRGRAVDLCTGSGAIAAHMARQRPEATVIGVDICQRAVRCAAVNGVRVLRGDLGESLAGASFDVVVAVPPYVPTDDLRLLPRDVVRHEPRRSLDGGGGGLVQLRRVVASARRLLRPGGWLLTELGGEQDVGLGPTLGACGFGEVDTWADEDGDLRGLSACLLRRPLGDAPGAARP